MPAGKTSSKVSSAARFRQCLTCTKWWDSKGFGSHTKACARKHSWNLQQKAYEQENEQPAPNSPSPQTVVQDSVPASDKPWEQYGRLDSDSGDESEGTAPLSSKQMSSSKSSDFGSNGSAMGNEHIPLKDDIKIEYHPSTQRPPELFSFAEYQASRQHHRKTQIPRNKRPWKPFRHRSEFEFAEVAIKSSLSKKQVNALIQVIQRLKNGEDKFEIGDHDELCAIWDAGTVLHTAPSKHAIPVEYKPGDVRTFDFWSYSLWDWAVRQVEDPFLAPHFQWDAKRLYKFDGSKYVRFFDEPSTGNRLWDIQNQLPSDGTPLFFIIYADKTKLSSFGTVMGYPVYARIGNLDIDVRNSNGVGGGELVGWLPIVPEDEAEKGKKEYADFKRIVWHQSFSKLLESISTHSVTGCWVQCGDGVRRRLFPFVLILSADYEEQCVMSLNRGFLGAQPCPICHVPRNQMHNLRGSWPLRTAIETQGLIDEARSLDPVAGEHLLQKNGLCPIDSAFLTVRYSDAHKALSYDRMHNASHGLGGKHLFSVVIAYLRATGRNSLKILDTRFGNMPSWSGLTHFDQVVSVEFTDASKLEDLVKILLFMAHDLIGPKYPEALALFSALRAYLNVFMYTGFYLHTKETIKSGQKELGRFSDLMIKFKAKIRLPALQNKNWDIPKMHLHTHAFSDITDKGASRNYNTKPFEQMHGPLKEIYHQIGNRKNVDEQIMYMNHRSRILAIMRSEVDLYDQSLLEEPIAAETNVKMHGHIIFGSKQNRCTLKNVATTHSSDPAFMLFERKFRQFINSNFSSKLSESEVQHILHPNSFIREYRYLKVSFMSRVTWDTQVNHLRCNPQFNGKPRYDFVLIKMPTGPIFAQLVFMFTTSTHTGRVDPWALIHPYDTHVGSPNSWESGLQLYRIHAKTRSSSRFISAESIIRGIIIIPAFPKKNDCYVFDLLDNDLFMRMQELWEERLG